MYDTRMQHALREAIKFFGSYRLLANAIGVCHQTIASWLNSEKRPSLEHAVRIMISTKGKISAYDLRPDLKALIDSAKKYLFCDVSLGQEGKKDNEVYNAMKKEIQNSQDKKPLTGDQVRNLLLGDFKIITLSGLDADYSESSDKYHLSVNKDQFNFLIREELDYE